MRLFLDHHISKRVAMQLSDAGYALSTVEEERLEEADDEVVWHRAIELDCVMVTYNSIDFVPLFEKFWNEGRDHPGLVLISSKTIKSNDFGGLLRALKALLDDPPVLENRMHHLRSA